MKKTVLFSMPGTEDVRVQPDEVFGKSGATTLTMDLYFPPDVRGPLPAVVLVPGYPDEGVKRIMGDRFKEMGSATSWARLIACSGMAAIVPTNVDPVVDAQALVDHLRTSAVERGIDPDRLGLWASSGNAPLALWLLMKNQQAFRCATFICPVTLDLDGATGVAESAAQFRFANPASGASVDDLPRTTAIFLARAGQDEIPRLNESLDRVLTHAVARNLPVTFVNHAEAPHAFDLVHDSERTREIVASLLTFLQTHLLR